MVPKHRTAASKSKIAYYPSMPYPEDANCLAYLDNSLILAKLNYNNEELRSEFEHLFSHMTVFHTYHSANSCPIFERNIQYSTVPKPLNLSSLTPPRKAMTLPSPTTLHHQTMLRFSTTFISTLTKLFSQSD
ncbi:hypothetical protein JHK82_018288 [Glycine max]|nr:hypothetical protein JHK82_018288 [Glycine max]